MSETTRHGSPRITKKQWAQFIANLRIYGNVCAACNAAGISATKTAYRHAKTNPDFAEEWADALLDSQDVIHAEMHRRGITGWYEPVISVGNVVKGPDGKPLMKWVASDAVLLRMHASRTDEGKALRAPPPLPPPESEDMVAARMYKLIKAMEATIGGDVNASVVSATST